MKYCKVCIEPNTRPDADFDETGICMPCRYAAEASAIDWDARRRELEEIAEWAKSTNVSGYDCIIPVSGGKDSHRQALYCRDELDLKPLLVSCAYPPEEQTDRGAANIANLIDLGFDCIYVSPGPETWRRAMRVGFTRFGNIYKSTELPLYAATPKVAIAYHIPLVVYGENPAISWGGAGGSLDGDANRLKYSNTLSGGDMSWLLDAAFDPDDLYWYTYPSDEDIDRARLRLIYLGYYMDDFNDFVNGPVSVAAGLTCREGADADPEQTGNLEVFDALDCDFLSANQMIKRMKFGFGKVSEQCSMAVRWGRMDRAEAVDKTTRYDGRCAPRFIRAFCEFTGLTEDEFWDVAESYRNPDIWERDGNEWKLKQPPE
ncbi:MAG: N-acetyl sugar amidotransferase [Alphaproteobacteria bacterium]|nr:N-acetyl sugar amidotransferase [Alphaproteobacteria bacterium]